jgi:hypothetical protein
LSMAAGRSGVDMEGLGHSLGHLQKSISEAAIGGGEAGHVLNLLGLDAQALSHMTADEQLGKVADAMQQIGNRGDQAMLAMKLFGRSGAELLPTLDLGSEGIKKMARPHKG